MYPDYKHMLRHLPAFAAIASPKNTLFYSDLIMRAEIGVEVCMATKHVVADMY